MQRLKGLDAIRGVGILCVVLLHSATFHFDGITGVNFDDPPLLITVIGFLLMWAGLFALISGAAYGYSTALRVQGQDARPGRILARFWVAGGFALVLHYVYFLVVGPKLLDVVHGNHQYALLPGLIATGSLPAVPVDRLFYSTALSMVAWNLILCGPLIGLLGRWRALRSGWRAGALLGGLGTVVILVSVARIPLYPLAVGAIEQGQVVRAWFWGFVVNKNNPIVPYLGFGLYGAWFGMALANSSSRRRALLSFLGLGIVWLVAGTIGLALLPDTMLERDVDLTWYFIIVFQLGLFLSLLAGVLFFTDVARISWVDRLFSPLRTLGTVSLSIFMLETVLSQILVRIGDALSPGWRYAIGPCLAFGALNVLLWVGIVSLWSRSRFRFSMEWCTVQVYRLFGQTSEKLDAATAARRTTHD